MSLYANARSKSLLLVLVCLVVFLLDLLSTNLAVVSRNYLNSDYCISDTVFELTASITRCRLLGFTISTRF